ncbi:MAG: hypothetical protein JOZ05_12145 [Acetobacteraceae bacterium]|nr:hypothetical protein [Acetobacteraceae bacterium]
MGFAAVAFVLGAAAAQAQGIDCGKARTPIEKAICGSPELMALDRQVGAAFADAVTRQPERVAGLRQEQLAWLRARDAACNVPAAQLARCLSGQMSGRLAQLAPPPTAASAATAPPVVRREPAIPSDFNPKAPAASVEPAAFPAAEQTDAILRVTSPGRFALAAHSATGVALQLVDQLTGPAEIVGDAGVRDGRTDVLLDIGTYRLRAFAAKGATGEVRLTADPFGDAAPPRALPLGGETFSAELRDGQQRAFWLLVPPSGAVQIEAAGRALADLRLWRVGRELVGLEPTTSTIEPQPGRPMLDLRLSGKVEPGVYLAAAYGGPALPWADRSAGMPFHVRGGLSEALAEGWASGPVGPFGSERYVAPSFAGVFRLDLPQPDAAELRVDDSSAVLEKRSREPHAVLRGNPGKVGIVEVRGLQGQAFTLRASAPALGRSVTRPGSYWVSAVANGAGGDEAPATVLLQRTDPKLPARIVASNLPRLAPGSAWRGRFNLRGPTSLLFENAVGGPVALTTSGISLGSEPGGYAQYDAPADTYVLRLRPPSGVQGVIDVTVGPPGIQPPRPQTMPTDPVVPLGVQEVGPGQSLQLVAQSGPGLETGLSARPVPVALAEGPVFATQAPGSGALSVPVALAPGGTLSARELDGADIQIADAPAPGGGRLITIPASDRPRTVVLAWRRTAVPADIPPPPQAATIPTLRPGVPLPFDLARDEQRGFALEVAQGGLYRVETLGRLRTSGRIASAFIPELDAAEANGAGQNFLLQDWLRAGRYRVDVQARDSAGHLAVAASPAPLADGATLAAESSVRASMPAGSGVAFPVRIEREGQYHFDLLSLGKPFTVRLDDADGWPATRPGPTSALDEKLRPGTYRLLVSPEPVARRVVARLHEVVEPAAISGHGPHELPFGAQQSATWREPFGRSDPRTPDVWTFELAGPAEVTLRIDDGMVAELRRDDRTLARLTKRWSGRLEAGAYRVEATSQGRNDRLDYAIRLEAKEIQPGETRTVTLPATIPFALAEGRVATLTTWGSVPVKAVLRRADGTEVVRAGARADDWNIAISRPLPQGAYRLELAAAVPPSGGSATPQDPGVVPAADEPDQASGGDDKPDMDDQDAQTAPRSEQPDSSESADAGDQARQSVELRLALPSGGAVQAVPLPNAAPGTLIAGQTSGDGASVLAIEREDGDGWRMVALDQGTTPLVAAAADASAQPWLLEAWSIDGSAPPQVRSAVLAAEPQASGAVTLSKVGSLDLAAARVRLPAPGLVQVEGVSLAAGSPGHAAEPVEGGQASAQGGEEIWVLAPEPGTASVVPLQFEAERAVTVPAGGTVALPELPRSPGRMRLWHAESGAGQPVFASREPGAVALNSAIAPAEAGTVLANGTGAEALPVRLAPLDLQLLPDTGPGPALLPPRAALPVRLPGPGRVSLTLSPGTAALSERAAAWAGDGPLARDVFAAGGITLVNTTEAPAPVTVQWTEEAPWPELQPGRVIKRFFGASGSIDLVAASGGTVAVAGDAELLVWGDDGRVRRGRVIRIEDAARVTVTHAPGAVVVSMAGFGVSPWALAPVQQIDLPYAAALSGPAMALGVAPDRPVLLHVVTTAPVLIGVGDHPPELFAAGAEFHRALPGESTVLRLYSPHDGPLSGTVELAAEALRPAKEGVGESVAVAPGGSAAFAFSLARSATVGVGVRADPDRAQVRLLNAKGAVVGEGIAQLQKLPAGSYVLEARVPPDAPPTLIRPAVVGMTPPGHGPPPDVVQHYLELVGLKPTEPGK